MSARNSCFLNVISLTPNHSSAFTKKIASSLWVQLLPPTAKNEFTVGNSNFHFLPCRWCIRAHSLYGAAAGVQGRVRPEGAGEGKILGVADKVGAKGQKRKHMSGDRHKHAVCHSWEPGQGGCPCFYKGCVSCFVVPTSFYRWSEKVLMLLA